MYIFLHLFRFDPWCLLQAFKNRAISLGVEYVDGEVSGFEPRKIPGGQGMYEDFEMLNSVEVFCCLLFIL